jgi:hypothetical protein
MVAPPLGAGLQARLISPAAGPAVAVRPTGEPGSEYVVAETGALSGLSPISFTALTA